MIELKLNDKAISYNCDGPMIEVLSEICTAVDLLTQELEKYIGKDNAQGILQARLVKSDVERSIQECSTQIH